MEIPSVILLVKKNIITEGYTDEMKRINLFFYYQRIYRRKKNYLWKIHRRSISVGKLITDRICVLRRWKNSVGKTVKSCSDTGVIVHGLSWYCWIYLVKIFFYNIVGVLIVVLVCLYNFFFNIFLFFLCGSFHNFFWNVMFLNKKILTIK
jgi:hypothetical protein